MKKDKIKNSRDDHPCYNSAASGKFGRIHLPVAPLCNIRCKYCERRFHCVNESRPGVCYEILSPSDALEKAKEFIARDPRIRVVGIAGPGDPLANKETFELLALVHSSFPDLLKCLSTNGLLLPDRISALSVLGVQAITVTLNSLQPETGARIYSHVDYGSKRYYGADAAGILIENQLRGIHEAAECGMSVKVNSVLIPGVNSEEMPEIAKTAKKLGAELMNIIPVMPLGEFSGLIAPSRQELEAVRKKCEPEIRIMRHCRMCRADAVGLLTAKEDTVFLKGRACSSGPL